MNVSARISYYFQSLKFKPKYCIFIFGEWKKISENKYLNLSKTFASRRSPECGKYYDGFGCTREANHSGDHVAHGGYCYIGEEEIASVIAVWNEDTNE